MTRLALVVKYHPPSPRISGVIGFVSTLARHLAARCELHVVTSSVPGAPRHEETDGYQVHRVAWPFPVVAGRAVARLDADACLVVSSVYDLRKAAAYFGVLHSMLDRRARRLFLQATIPSGVPPRSLHRVLRRTDRVLCAGEEIAALFRPAFGHRTEVLTPAVDVGRLTASARRDAQDSAFRVGFVNHLNAVKGFDVAARVFERLADELPDAEFVVAGTGDLEDRVPTGLGHRLVHHGWMPEEERVALMSTCDVMYLPFRTGISVLGLSQTVLECLALGVVVVGSDTASIAPAIRDGVDGYVVDDEEAAIARITELVRDPALRAQLGAAAFERVRAEFDVATRADRIVALAHRGSSDEPS